MTDVAKDPALEHSAEAVIEGDWIVIRVWIAALPDALAQAPSPLSLDYRITDAQEFSKDLVIALNDENPDNGTTPIHRLLDDAMESAIDFGSLAVEQIAEDP